MLNHMYIVTTVSLSKKTNEVLLKEYKVWKSERDRKDDTYELFIDIQKSLHRDVYRTIFEDNSYFLNKKKAFKTVVNNRADINDGGIFNYCLIKKVLLSTAYANEAVYSVDIFKFNKDKNEYELIDESKYSKEEHHIIKSINLLS